ncbi:MAG: sigma-70 family RNA polymerase sigma factor [Oscillospiraceae bacterium]|nr:sigma-70 family RNA polymerase sigma factor [Oscillospiraceae bacterium]
MELLQETLGSRLRRSLAQAWAFVRSAVSAPEAQAQGLALDAGRALDEWGTSILRLALSYLHSREDAEDILQDTLIRYLTAKPVLQSREHEKAWLLRVAANLCKNRIDYNRVRQADELKEELLGEEREDLAFVWEAVAQLPEAQRAAIHLYYHEGYQTAEIARILGRREATVRSDLKRGRERLKASLKEAYDFDPIQ